MPEKYIKEEERMVPFVRGCFPKVMTCIQSSTHPTSIEIHCTYFIQEYGSNPLDVARRAEISLRISHIIFVNL